MKFIRSRTVVMPQTNIDTDQIIPARFLTTTTRTGLGEGLFYDWRFDARGQPRTDFVLNRPGAENCQVLVAGRNFGCGSSREHAPWALADFGFRAVVSCKIADIFRGNALKNGLLPVVVDEAVHEWMLANPGVEIEIDVAATEIRLPDGTKAGFPLDPFARYCLLEDIDELGFLLAQEEQITAYEKRGQ